MNIDKIVSLSTEIKAIEAKLAEKKEELLRVAKGLTVMPLNKNGALTQKPAYASQDPAYKAAYMKQWRRRQEVKKGHAKIGAAKKKWWAALTPEKRQAELKRLADIRNKYFESRKKG